MITQQEYADRRNRVKKALGQDGIMIIPSAHETLRNADTEYLFRQKSDFYYITGYKEPGALAIIAPHRKEGEYILFNRVRDRDAEVWTGRRVGQAGAVAEYGVDQAFSYEEINAKLPEILQGYQKIYYPMGENFSFDQQVLTWINQMRSAKRINPIALINSQDILHEMRLRKSAAEIDLMRHAGQVSAKAHVRAMTVCRPGMWEYQIQAELLYEFARHDCYPMPYNAIVGSGPNSCILHYNDNNAQLKDGDMLLIDAAGEYQCYAADVTRTFPVNGKFSSEQRAIYEIVLAAQKSTITKVKTGISCPELLDHSVKIISQGLLDLGLLKGSLNEVIEKKTYREFYMHNIGHWLGLDTHDVGTYRIGQEARHLEPGMVFTVEPGIYIRPSDKVDEKWWNIGVRIEDDVLVTEQEPEVLTQDAPKEITEIENLMANRQKVTAKM